MKKTQRINFNMGKTVITYGDTVPTTITDGLPMFIIWFLGLKAIWAAIAVHVSTQDAILSAFQSNKKLLREKLVKSTLHCTAILQSYATASGNVVLYDLMNINKSMLNRLSFVDLIAVCDNVSAALTANILSLVAYNFTATDGTDYAALIVSYTESNDLPETAKLASKEATREVKAKLLAGKKLLKNMDGVVTTAKNAYPLFYNMYFDARKLIALPTFMQAARGKITNKAGEVMPFVTISSPSWSRTRKASKNGTFILKSATEGLLELNFEFPGYKKESKIVTITTGMRAEVLVVMDLEEVAEAV